MTGHEHGPPNTPDRHKRRAAAEADTVALPMPRVRRLLALSAAAVVGSLIGRWLDVPSWLTAGLAAGLASFCLRRWGPSWLSPRGVTEARR